MAIRMKAGDTAPVVRATLLDENGDPVNLTGATVKFVMASTTTPRTVHIDEVAVLADAANGAVEYPWAVGDTALPAGEYVAEFEVVFADSRVQTFPTDGFVDVQIIDDLGGTA